MHRIHCSLSPAPLFLPALPSPSIKSACYLSQARGFTSFLRLGSLKRISKEILGHSLHQAGGDDGSKAGQQDALSILKEMLAETQSSEEQARILRGQCTIKRRIESAAWLCFLYPISDRCSNLHISN